MSQRQKVIVMITKAQGILSQAANENLPIWASNDIRTEVGHLNEIIAALKNIPDTYLGIDLTK